MFKGNIELTNDKDEQLASVLWFYDEGPFYAFAMDVSDTTVLRRIGPCTTLESAKAACMRALEGKMDISKRAGYLRNE
jgi:hypothetical protein